MSKKNELQKRLEVIQKQLEAISLEMRLESEKTQKTILETLIKLTKSKEFVDDMRDKLGMEVSFALLAFSIFLSALIGIVANFFVSFWFQPTTGSTSFGLWLSGGMLIGFFAVLLYEYRRFLR